ncbi:uncharacterized protein MKK02DRAFT_38052 [Dioszegia hungarica]|uniref:Uncharacterized protein n=1 Tax=Dioszegia hungarica TaxID=4972 RepID=A0AA38H6C5_9TREE|nr:uncharacterized protein MKK02DRAFT_38052 [Dioszegia hungarica]KAI9634521.1 hypothetical protein MKK02DRAFT_38052 [Dioszegia hungarica]
MSDPALSAVIETSPSLMADTRSPARLVYDNGQLRREVISYLPNQDLARFIRVERGCLWDIVRVLYREIRVGTGCHHGPESERRATYREAVFDLDALSMALPPETRPGRAARPSYLEYGDSHIIRRVVPTFRQKLPNLRTIRFGTRRSAVERISCEIRFDAARPAGASADDGDSGSINYFTTCHLLLKGPPSRLETPPSPAGSYTVNHRCDLTLMLLQPTAQDTQRWLDALQDGPALARLTKHVKLDGLNTSLPVLTRLYERQAEAGFTDGLATIFTPQMAPFDIDAFRTFASAASSLTSLILVGERPAAGVPIGHTTFSELPTLVEVIRRDLPHLVKLHLAIGGIGTAGEDCKSYLTPGGLCLEGTIQDLRIDTGGTDKPQFNLVRAISPICTSKARLAMQGGAVKTSWKKDDHVKFLHYLRSQPQSRRIHLAMVDFGRLGIHYPRQVQDLTYDDGGRPRTVQEQMLRNWSSKTSLGLIRAREMMGKVDAGLQGCVEASSSLAGMSSEASKEDRLKEADKLWEGLESAQAAAKEMIAASWRMTC